MSQPRFTFLPAARDSDVIEGYGYARLLMGHGCEPWLARALSAWIVGAKAELARRGLLKQAKRNEDAVEGSPRAQGRRRVMGEASDLEGVSRRLRDVGTRPRRRPARGSPPPHS
jgi:hypothetical protein